MVITHYYKYSQNAKKSKISIFTGNMNANLNLILETQILHQNKISLSIGLKFNIPNSNLS